MITTLRRWLHALTCRTCREGMTIWLPATREYRATHLPTYRLRPVRRMAGRA